MVKPHKPILFIAIFSVLIAMSSAIFHVKIDTHEMTIVDMTAQSTVHKKG